MDKDAYTMKYYSAIKNKWEFAICNNTDGVRGYYAEWNKSQRNNSVLYYLHMESKKHNKLVNITKNRLIDTENSYQGEGERKYKGRELRDINCYI